ncbi:uncharacterized protein LTR77_004550 [Saxophila tyrrhenica]|uniref:Uncharacterized protein n=1 Tax=Saxophila tyrrhenica TaxID=1690608 RepID=A0AAV9PDE2_9PEZI|nr:hypothetical protein LTR77_004550 [Saxophila tyrrhenica]
MLHEAKDDSQLSTTQAQEAHDEELENGLLLQYAIGRTTADRAQEVLIAVMNGAKAPRKDQLRFLAADEADLREGVLRGAKYVVNCCNNVIRRDPGNVHATPLRETWQPIGREVDDELEERTKRILREAAEEALQKSPMVDLYYKCMRAVARVRCWAMNGTSAA